MIFLYFIKNVSDTYDLIPFLTEADYNSSDEWNIPQYIHKTNLNFDQTFQHK